LPQPHKPHSGSSSSESELREVLAAVGPVEGAALCSPEKELFYVQLWPSLQRVAREGLASGNPAWYRQAVEMMGILGELLADPQVDKVGD
jgi:hypothetical protein